MRKFNEARKRAFLKAYRHTASIKAAAAAVGIQKDRHYDWLKADPNYVAAFEMVQDEAGQALEDEAVRRALDGVKRPLFFQGKPLRDGKRRVYEIEFDNHLLLALLKRFRPKLYREQVTTEVTGSLELIDRLTAGRKRVLEFKQQHADNAERPAGT